MSLTAQTTNGVLWNFAEQLARRGVGILVTLLLARFLVPEDFGLIAMMSVFLALGSSLMESGFREALIRLQNVTQEDYATAFYANILLGLISYGVLFFVAPTIATFYEEPRLVELIRVASLTIIIMSFQTVQIASLTRKLNFRAQLTASLPSSFVSGAVAVYLAYAGGGAWALVSQIILNASLHTALLWKLEGWRPTRDLSWPSLKAMYNFGYKLFLAGILDTVFQNLYVIVIAKVFSAQTAGLYFFANKIKELIVQQLVTSIQRVTYPALASVQTDNVRLKAGYKKIVVLMTMILYPSILFIAALAEPIFQVLLPEKWHPAVPYFQLLCIATLMIPLHSINLNILKVKGRSDLFLYLEIIKKTLAGLVLLASYRYGVYAILCGQAIVSFINYIPNSYFSTRLLNYGVREQASDFFPTLVISLVASGAGFLMVRTVTFGPIYKVILGMAVMISLLIILNILFNRERCKITAAYVIKFLPLNKFNVFKS